MSKLVHLAPVPFIVWYICMKKVLKLVSLVDLSHPNRCCSAVVRMWLCRRRLQKQVLRDRLLTQQSAATLRIQTGESCMCIASYLEKRRWYKHVGNNNYSTVWLLVIYVMLAETNITFRLTLTKRASGYIGSFKCCSRVTMNIG